MKISNTYDVHLFIWPHYMVELRLFNQTNKFALSTLMANVKGYLTTLSGLQRKKCMPNFI